MASSFGRTPEMPIGTVGSPNFRDFANPNDSPATQTRQVVAKLRERDPESLVRKRSPKEVRFNIKSSGSRRAKRIIIFYAKLFIDTKMAKLRRIPNGEWAGSIYGDSDERRSVFF